MDGSGERSRPRSQGGDNALGGRRSTSPRAPAPTGRSSHGSASGCVYPTTDGADLRAGGSANPTPPSRSRVGNDQAGDRVFGASLEAAPASAQPPGDDPPGRAPRRRSPPWRGSTRGLKLRLKGAPAPRTRAHRPRRADPQPRRATRFDLRRRVRHHWARWTSDSARWAGHRPLLRRVRRRGGPDGPAGHGPGDADDRLERGLLRAARRAFHVVRFDNRDIGRSTHMDFTPPTSRRSSGGGCGPSSTRSPTWPATPPACCASWAIAPHRVVGASMGGMVGQTLAAEHPELVRSLTSIMSNTGNRWRGQPHRASTSTSCAARPRTATPTSSARSRSSASSDPPSFTTRRRFARWPGAAATAAATPAAAVASSARSSPRATAPARWGGSPSRPSSSPARPSRMVPPPRGGRATLRRSRAPG